MEKVNMWARQIEEQMNKRPLFDLVVLLFLCAHAANQRPENLFDSMFSTYTFYGLVIVTLVLFIREKHIYVNKYEIVFVIFFLYCALSTLWSANPSLISGVRGSLVKNLFFMFAVSTRVKSKQDVDQMFRLALFATIYCMVLLLIRTPIEVYGTQRIGEELGLNSNGLGIRFFVGIILALYFLLSENMEGGFKRSILVVLIGMFFILALFTGSRKASFACLAAICGVLFFAVDTPKKRVRRLFLIACVAFIAIYLIFSVSDIYNVVGKRFDSLFLFIRGDKSADSSGFIRGDIANQALIVFKNNPILGCGANNFMAHNSYGIYSHNNYLELLSTLGIIGFLLYYYRSFSMLHICRKSLKVNKKNQTFVMCILIIIIGICEFGLVSYYGVFYQSVLCIASLYALQLLN